MTVGSTSGSIYSSQVTSEAHQFMTSLCNDIQRALQIMSDAITQILQYAADNSPWPGIGEVLQKVADKANELFTKINEMLGQLCRDISDTVIPIVLAPQILIEVTHKWDDISMDATNLAHKFTNENLDSIAGFAINEWQGAGVERYQETITRQHEAATTAADVSHAVGDALMGAAEKTNKVISGTIATIEGFLVAVGSAIAGLGTWETIIGAIAGVLGAIGGIIKAVSGLIETVQGFMIDTAQMARDMHQELKAFADNFGSEWPGPHDRIGGQPGSTISTNTAPAWDDGDN